MTHNETSVKTRITTSSHIEEFTDTELRDLTPAEIERYIDLECARRGLPLLPQQAGDPPGKPVVDLSTTVYAVSWGYSSVMTLRDQDAALALSEALTEAAKHAVETLALTRSYEVGKLGDYIKGPSDRDVKVEPEAVAPTETKQLLDAEIQDYERLYKRWKEADDEYKKATKERQETRDWVYELIYEAERLVAAQERAQRRLDRYIDLAGGDRMVGVLFLEAHAKESGSEDITLLELQDEIDGYTTVEDPAPADEEDQEVVD